MGQQVTDWKVGQESTASNTKSNDLETVITMRKKTTTILFVQGSGKVKDLLPKAIVVH